MNKKEQMRIVYISYIVVIIISSVVNYLKLLSFEYKNIIESVKASTILTCWWLFYFNIGWKWNWINKILYKENLNGTWFGTYKSIGEDNQEFQGNIVLRIKQTFLSISITSYTEKYSNYSYSEDLQCDEKSGIYDLIYVYSQKENNILDLSQRNGTADLKVVKKENEDYGLIGEFWTIVNSKGTLELIRVSSKIANSFSCGQKFNEEYKKRGSN